MATTRYGWGLPLLLAAALIPNLATAGEGGVAARRDLLAAADSPRVMVVAHRACWRGTAENSIAAIDACVAMGVDMVEIDVWRTRDGALILMHDESVDRTTNGTGRVADLTLAQVRALRLRAGAGGPAAPVTALAPPTLGEAMEAARGRILVNLDAKADVYNDAVIELARLGLMDHIVMKRRVVTGDPPLTSAAPFDRVMSMPIVDQAAGDSGHILDRQAQGRPVAIELIFRDLEWLEVAARRVEAMDARVWVNTLNPELAGGLTDTNALRAPDAVWGALILRGVDMIQTDEPATLITYLRRLGRR